MPAKSDHRILITGGSGFVAPFLIRQLEAQDCQVIAPGCGEQPAVDICDRDAVGELIKHVQPTALVHLAAVAATAEARSAPDRAWDVNFGGTRNLAEAILAHAPEAKFVFAGSSDAYGASFVENKEPLSESAALQPMNVYAATKAAADILIGQLTFDGLRAIRFRPFNHTGPGQSEIYVVPAFARQVARIAAGLQEPIVRVGNIEVERDFLDVRDVARAYALAVFGELPETPGLVFNLATGTTVRLSEVLNRLIARAGVAVEVTVDPAKVRSADVPRTCGDFSRARQALGWTPQIPLETTLSDILDYWRGQF